MIVETNASSLNKYVGFYTIISQSNLEKFGIKIISCDGVNLKGEFITGENKGKTFSAKIPEPVDVKVYDEEDLIVMLMEIK